LRLARQALFLGQLTATESGKLTDRLVRFLVLKVVFFGAVVTARAPDLTMWLSWCDWLTFCLSRGGLELPGHVGLCST
jgi:hypothetical protein